MDSAPRNWPAGLAIGLLAAALALLLRQSVALAGALSYALDDAYIHMAMAKSFAEHGVWGITRHGFTSSSSSLIWTATLAALFKGVGVREWIPLALNAALSLATLAVMGRLLQRSGLGAGWTAALLVALAFLTPLPALTFTGQEHVLQVLVTTLLIHQAARALADEPGGDPSALTSLYLLGPLAVLTRFEGLFPAFLIGCLFLLRRRIRDGITFGAITLAPLAAFGALSVSKGWLPLPNSVLMKGNLTRTLVGVVRGDPTTAAFWGNLGDLVGGAAIRQLLTAPHVLGLVVTAVILYAFRWGRGRRLWDRGQLGLLLFLATTFFHMELAKVGWFFRYEAYLVALGIYAIGAAAGEILPGATPGAAPRPSAQRWILVGLMLVSLMPLGARGWDAFTRIPRATKNIHEQQYQMGRFLAEHYEGTTVTANDIGAITFLADIGCVDLVGLASMEAAQLRRKGQFNAEGMDLMSRRAGATIAVAYEPWLVKWGGVPPTWVEVGRWRIPDNVVVAHDTVTWYGLSVDDADRLAQRLKAFSPQLPPDVEESGPYLDAEPLR